MAAGGGAWASAGMANLSMTSVVTDYLCHEVASTKKHKSLVIVSVAMMPETA
jgi:hypothetical protein